jgi:hypothetical protein
MAEDALRHTKAAQISRKTGNLRAGQRQLTEQPLQQYFLTTRHPSDVEPWHGLLAENSPGALPPEIPVFLAQGTDDVIIHPKVTEDYRNANSASSSKRPRRPKKPPCCWRAFSRTI